MPSEQSRVWDRALWVCLFFVISLRIAESGVGSVPFKIIADFSPHCLGVSTHLTAKTSVFIEVLTLAHDQLIKWILLATPDCELPLNSYGSQNNVELIWPPPNQPFKQSLSFGSGGCIEEYSTLTPCDRLWGQIRALQHWSKHRNYAYHSKSKEKNSCLLTSERHRCRPGWPCPTELPSGYSFWLNSLAQQCCWLGMGSHLFRVFSQYYLEF